MTWLRFLAGGLAAFLIFNGGKGGADCWYLRVIGRNDTAAAQEEKLRVRDAVWAVCPDEPAMLTEALPAIRQAAESVASCQIELRFWSPGDGWETQPTLYITVGEGQGHNWWGVLYDGALHMAQAKNTEKPEDTDDEVEFVWPLWEWLLRLFGKR